MGSDRAGKGGGVGRGRAVVWGVERAVGCGVGMAVVWDVGRAVGWGVGRAVVWGGEGSLTKSKERHMKATASWCAGVRG